MVIAVLIGLVCCAQDVSAAESFQISNISSPQTEGTPFSITITAMTGGSPDVSYSGTVSFSIDAALSITPTVSPSFVNGVATFDVTVTGTGSATITVQDGGASGSSHSFDVTAANNAPTLTTVNTLAGAAVNTPFPISYADLAAAADAADADSGDIISFRIEAVSSGTLTKNATPAPPGTTLSSGETLVWTPALDANRTLNAFTIVASDGTAVSTPAVQVQVSVAAVNDPPVNTVLGVTKAGQLPRRAPPL